jgi:hypothetical protein
MSEISLELRTLVAERAGHRCEEATFHIDHVIPRTAGGNNMIDNLALACVSCSLRKWAKETALDPVTGLELPLFNPRTDIWSEHFRWEGVRIVAQTAVGRATHKTLAMNRPLILAIREKEIACGRHPPS